MIIKEIGLHIDEPKSLGVDQHPRQTRIMVIYLDGTGDAITMLHDPDGLPADQLARGLKALGRLIGERSLPVAA